MKKINFKLNLIAAAVATLFGSGAMAATTVNTDGFSTDAQGTGTGFSTGFGGTSTDVTPGQIQMLDATGAALYQINLINISQNTGETASVTSSGIIIQDAIGNNISLGDGGVGAGNIVASGNVQAATFSSVAGAVSTQVAPGDVNLIDATGVTAMGVGTLNLSQNTGEFTNVSSNGIVVDNSAGGVVSIGSGPAIAGQVVASGNVTAGSGLTVSNVVGGNTPGTGNTQILSAVADGTRGLTVNAAGNVTTTTLSGGGVAAATANTLTLSGTTASLLNGVGAGHGLTIDSVTNTTSLTGGTNSSSLTLQDAAATLSVGTAATAEVPVIRATNAAGSTSVTIGGPNNVSNQLTAVGGDNTLDGDSNNINANAGSNNITALTDNNVLALAANNVTAQGGDNTLDASARNVLIGGTGNSVSATTGNNTVTAVAGSNTVNANAANGANTLNANGLNGVNTLSASAATGTNVVTAGLRNTVTSNGAASDANYINATAGGNTILANTNNVVTATNGKNTVTATNDVTDTANSLNATAGGNSVLANTNNVVTATNGKNTVTATNDVTNTANSLNALVGGNSVLANTNNIVTATNGMNTVTATLNATDTANSLNALVGGNSVLAKTNNVVTATDGKNTITATNNVALDANAMTASAGGNTINANLQNTIIGGTGNSMTATTGGNTIAATLGANAITAGTSNTVTATTFNTLTAGTDNTISALAGVNALNALTNVATANTNTLQTTNIALASLTVSQNGAATVGTIAGNASGANLFMSGNTVSLLNNVVEANDTPAAGHGLTIGATSTKLTGGTNSSSLTLQDSTATLSVGTTTSAEIQLVNATNTGTGAPNSTGVTIGDLATSSNVVQGNTNLIEGTTSTTIGNAATYAGSNAAIQVVAGAGVDVKGGANSISANTGMNTITGQTGNLVTATAGANVLTATGAGGANTLTALSNTMSATTGTNILTSAAGANTITQNIAGAATGTSILGTGVANGIMLAGTVGANTANATLSGNTATYEATGAAGTRGLKVNSAAAGSVGLTGGDAGVVLAGTSAFWNSASLLPSGTTSGSAAVGAALAVLPAAQVGLAGANAYMVNNTGHGIAVTGDHTTITGGTTSTAMTLNDGGATFSNATTGAPVRVMGVADGSADYDAVNVRQLKGMETLLSRGVASTTAIANIPQVDPGKTFAVGVGLGSFNGESAVAVGGSYRFIDNGVMKASLGTSGGKSTYGVGAAMSW